MAMANKRIYRAMRSGNRVLSGVFFSESSIDNSRSHKSIPICYPDSRLTWNTTPFKREQLG